VLFPAKTSQRYYEIHYRYVLNVLRHGGAEVELAEMPSEHDTQFSCHVDGRPVIFDFSDAGLWRSGSPIPVFKFHHRADEAYRNVFPFSPVSFYEWDTYEFLRETIHYDPVGKRAISARQRAYGNAVERRQQVAARLVHAFGDDVRFEQIPQLEYWEDVDEIRIAAFVPGQNNNMLDRGQFQYVALGAATISPHLPERLPFGYTLDGCHLVCRDDYSDLVAQIRDAGDAALAAAGATARRVFAETSTPQRLVTWIALCLDDPRRAAEMGG
jgi:hypothetical protein